MRYINGNMMEKLCSKSESIKSYRSAKARTLFTSINIKIFKPLWLQNFSFHFTFNYANVCIHSTCRANDDDDDGNDGSGSGGGGYDCYYHYYGWARNCSGCALALLLIRIIFFSLSCVPLFNSAIPQNLWLFVYVVYTTVIYNNTTLPSEWSVPNNK